MLPDNDTPRIRKTAFMLLSGHVASENGYCPAAGREHSVRAFYSISKVKCLSINRIAHPTFAVVFLQNFCSPIPALASAAGGRPRSRQSASNKSAANHSKRGRPWGGLQPMRAPIQIDATVQLRAGYSAGAGPLSSAGASLSTGLRLCM